LNVVQYRRHPGASRDSPECPPDLVGDNPESTPTLRKTFPQFTVFEEQLSGAQRFRKKTFRNLVEFNN
jgi:hypothetical protein